MAAGEHLIFDWPNGASRRGVSPVGLLLDSEIRRRAVGADYSDAYSVIVGDELILEGAVFGGAREISLALLGVLVKRTSSTPGLAAGLLSVAFGIAAPMTATAQEAQDVTAVDSLKASLIRELLDVVGTPQLSLQALEASVEAQRAADTRIPPIFWDEFLERAQNDLDRFITWMMPVYDSHYSVADLEALITFYETPLGQRLLAAQPAVMQASIVVGQRWGSALGEEVATDLAARGIIIP